MTHTHSHTASYIMPMLTLRGTMAMVWSKVSLSSARLPQMLT
jgi:hypothetical protein